jgi:hypothetical protein
VFIAEPTMKLLCDPQAVSLAVFAVSENIISMKHGQKKHQHMKISDITMAWWRSNIQHSLL